ncbi:MAG TPA: VWA domain-containing protein [Candidatus Limnocylindrales bacterium]|nr:VWA domain-containing protein [Candidatus Limnocylindrales bacterium]
MSFLAPLALAGLLFLPVVVAMYLLKLRRDRAVIPSTLLWQALVADVEANAPWQKLRRSLLLLLQLLLVAILAILAARPFVERPAGLAGDLVLVVDTSASMQATDVTPTRLDAAKAAAVDALKDLPAGGKVSVISAGRTAKVIANGTTDLGRVKQAIASIAPSSDIGDLGDALRLASALAARSGDAEILVATDAALATPPAGSLEAPVRVLQVGREANNQAIVALAVRTQPNNLSHSAFVSVANLGLELVDRRLEVYADGRLREARTVRLDPQRRTDVSIDDVDDPDSPASVIEVRLTSADETATGAADPLAVDDRAWAIVPPQALRQILLVGERDPYLETALSYLPDTELYYRSGADYATTTGLDQFELVIFSRYLPAELPPNPVFAIAPPRTSDLGEVTGTLTNPAIGVTDPDDPILRYVDLSTVHVGEAEELDLPAWAKAIIPGPGGSPLLYAGTLDGRPAAVMAFEPRRSDLPLQVAFPVLLANLTGQLMGGSATPADAVAPGAPVTLAIPAGATGVRVERPDGSVDELVAPTADAATVTFARTDLLGVYTVTPMADPDATAAPSGAAATAPPASAGASPVARATDPDAPVRFAVDLLDVDESRIAPGDVAALTALGAPAASPGTGQAAAVRDRPNARDELWIPIVLIALLVLTIEWLVYERDTLARLRRAITARLGRRRAPTPGRGA